MGPAAKPPPPEAHAAKPLRWITLDMDSSVSPTHGTQEGTARNGHFDCSCYHPLFVFNQFGHLERCKLRPGNVHSADGWEEVLGPVMARYADRDILRLFRADAAFALPALYATLETAGYLYAIRLPKNALLQERIADLSRRPVGRPPNEVRRVYGEFEYQAGSWDKPRRVLAKVEWHPGDLFPRVGFLVTNLPFEPEQVFAFYNQRGTAEHAHAALAGDFGCKFEGANARHRSIEIDHGRPYKAMVVMPGTAAMMTTPTSRATR